MDLPWSQVCRRKSSLLALQAHPLGQDKRIMGAFLTNWKQSGLKTAPTPCSRPPLPLLSWLLWGGGSNGIISKDWTEARFP